VNRDEDILANVVDVGVGDAEVAQGSPHERRVSVEDCAEVMGLGIGRGTH
jgi:hypothetical protein